MCVILFSLNYFKTHPKSTFDHIEARKNLPDLHCMYFPDTKLAWTKLLLNCVPACKMIIQLKNVFTYKKITLEPSPIEKKIITTLREFYLQVGIWFGGKRDALGSTWSEQWHGLWPCSVMDCNINNMSVYHALGMLPETLANLQGE